MASSFFGLYVQRNALQLAQKGLDITGNNISNLQTTGYSRQRLDVMSVVNNSSTLGYNNGVPNAGMGAEAIGVTQIRDKLLDGKVRKYNTELCDTGSKTVILSDIEDILDDVENEETGLAAILSNFKASFQSFSSTGADRRDLANICLSSAQSVVNVLKNFDVRISDCLTSTENDIENTNDRINTILAQMASLNTQIKDGYVQMEDILPTRQGYQADVQYGPLELKDTFNNLADELSQYLNITVSEQADGTFDVYFADNTLVHNNEYARTDIKFRDDLADTVTTPDGSKLTAAFVESRAFYDSDGKQVTDEDGNFLADYNGTFNAYMTLYNKSGDKLPVTYDENNQLVIAKDDPVDGLYAAVDKLYVIGENKFYWQDGTEVSDWGTVNDGASVYDEEGNKIKVNGSFDAESLNYQFVEFYVSNTNTEKGWIKAEREVTDEMSEITLYTDPDTGEGVTMATMLNEFNYLIQGNEIEEAYRYEQRLMDLIDDYNASAADEDKIAYDPIFKENINEKAQKEGIKPTYPSYALSVSNETDTLMGGTINGLFDMYNGEGRYSGVDGNSYQGIKYYQETIRSLAKTIVYEFNSIYDDVNAECAAADADYVPFVMFDFDGAESVANMEIAEEWTDNSLRAVHPKGTLASDYNYDELDNSWLNNILEAFENKHSFGTEPQEYTFEEFVAYYGDTMGSQLEYELSNYESTQTMLTSVSSYREEVMGVSMDEEGVNMMNYQKWYNAISRMITAIDECLDKLINGTGVVGL